MITDLTNQQTFDIQGISSQLNVAIKSILQEKLEKILFAKSESYVTPFAMILVSNSPKQIDAVAMQIMKKIKEEKLFVSTIKVDGNGEREWCIIDLGDCLINILTPEKFEKYAIEDILEGKFNTR
jgi:ribosomal silencing factor RsfS